MWCRRFPLHIRRCSGCVAIPVDLIILDVYMPQMNGLELLRMLRAEGVDSDVIMVTSANDAETIEALMRLGVTDYLIKPFGLERFQLALDTFCNRKNAIHDSAQGAFTQNKLDRALLHISAPVSQTKSAPPKGLQAKTLERIKLYLQQIPAGTPAMTLRGMWNCRLSRCGAM